MSPVQLPIAKVRFVAVSATIPNIQDIASWLQVPPAGLKAFGEEVRPVKIRTVVKGYAPTKTDFLFERRLNDYIFSVVAENSKSKPALVFCRSAPPQPPLCCSACLCHVYHVGTCDIFGRVGKTTCWLLICGLDVQRQLLPPE